ncbi:MULTISPECIES: fimbrial protein [unclassified Pseudomonas]|uniref:fimbrial protein n=1 Tax=unclassified Pseudomonas TaxID=196821 RepID=UPI000A1FC382|nr:MULTISPECIES: fimbrial protein [unclassified Pseudomonas]
MKKLTLAIALALSAGTAIAAPEEGQIEFTGFINPGGTCPIDLVNPGLGDVPWVSLGTPNANKFEKTGDTSEEVAFALRVTPGAGCVLPPNPTATVKFEPLHGIVGPGSDLYGIRQGGSAATGVGIAIKDDTGTKITPNTDSKPYDLYQSSPTDMLFYANYESIVDDVTHGLAQTFVKFTVALP